MDEQICKCGARLEALRYSSKSTKRYWVRLGTGEVCINNHWHEPTEPSPEPEAAPASEAQAPAEPDERPKCPDCNSVGMSHCSDPEHCGGVYWPDSKYQALRAELTQLRARAAILDAQEVELPASAVEERRLDGEYQTGKEYLDDRVAELERQLLDAQRAIQAKAELMQQQDDALKAHSVYCETGKETDFNRFARLRDAAIAAYDALAGKGE